MKSGNETSTSLFITAKVRWTIKSKTLHPMLGKPKRMPSAISVNATGKPRKIAKIIRQSMMMPRMGSLIILRLLLDVFEPFGPMTGVKRGNAPQDFSHSLEGDERTGDGYHDFQRPDDRAFR